MSPSPAPILQSPIRRSLHAAARPAAVERRGRSPVASDLPAVYFAILQAEGRSEKKTYFSALPAVYFAILCDYRIRHTPTLRLGLGHAGHWQMASPPIARQVRANIRRRPPCESTHPAGGLLLTPPGPRAIQVQVRREPALPVSLA